MKSKTLAILIAAFTGAICCDAFACGAWKPGRETHPEWQVASADKSLPASRLVYLVERESDQLAAVTFRNLGGQELHFCFGLGAEPATQKAALKPDAQYRFEVKASHFLNTYFTGSVEVWNVSEGAVERTDEPRPPQSVLPAAVTGPPQMFAVYPLEETTTFNPRMVLSLVVKKPDNSVAVQFWNGAHRTVHFDFRIAGFQAAGAKNPRVTLFPGMEDEVTFSARNTGDPAIESALVEVLNIRIGDESGSLISPERKEAAPRFVAPFGASALFATNNVEFNDRTVCQIPAVAGEQPAKMRLLNIGDRTVNLDPLIAAIKTVEAPRASIPAGGEVALDLEGVECRAGRKPELFVRRVRVGKDEGPYIGDLDEPRVTLQDGWLFPTVAGDTHPYNPKSIGYGVVDSGDSTIVKFVNFSDSPVHFDFRLPGYQDETNSNARISLGPRRVLLGQVKINYPINAACKVNVARKDARLSVAKVQIFNIRIGAEDEGAMLAEKAAAETK